MHRAATKGDVYRCYFLLAGMMAAPHSLMAALAIFAVALGVTISEGRSRGR